MRQPPPAFSGPREFGRFSGVCIAFLAFPGCRSDTTTAPAATTTSIEAPSAKAEEAKDALVVLRAFYPPGLAAGRAVNEGDACRFEAKGYAALVSCDKKIASAVEAAAARMPREQVATLPCGREIEAAHREFIASHMRFRADHARWLDTAKAKLAPRMVGRPQADACGETDTLCDGEPFEMDPTYGGVYGASYARVVNVECTKRLFECEPPAGNVCWINKVADRLGIGEGPAFGTLRVRE